MTDYQRVLVDVEARAVVGEGRCVAAAGADERVAAGALFVHERHVLGHHDDVVLDNVVCAGGRRAGRADNVRGTRIIHRHRVVVGVIEAVLDAQRVADAVDDAVDALGHGLANFAVEATDRAAQRGRFPE